MGSSQDANTSLSYKIVLSDMLAGDAAVVNGSRVPERFHERSSSRLKHEDRYFNQQRQQLVYVHVPNRSNAVFP